MIRQHFPRACLSAGILVSKAAIGAGSQLPQLAAPSASLTTHVLQRACTNNKILSSLSSTSTACDIDRAFGQACTLARRNVMSARGTSMQTRHVSNYLATKRAQRLAQDLLRDPKDRSKVAAVMRAVEGVEGGDKMKEALTKSSMKSEDASSAQANPSSESEGTNQSASAILAGGAGTESNPLYVSNVHTVSVKSMVLSVVRNLLLMYILLLVLSAAMEELGPGGMVGGGQRAAGATNKKWAAISADKDKKTFTDIRGAEEAKQELQEIVAFLKRPEDFSRLGGKMPKGVLLHGPPGTGKTLLARAVAGEAGVPFFYAAGSEFDEMFVGVGARRIRELFEEAKKHSPSILFIDEIDALGSKRNPRDPSYSRQTINQMLALLDGFSPSEGVIVMAATNTPETLDKALLRPGRFDKMVVVPNPDVGGRKDILSHYLSKVTSNVNAKQVDKLARGTSGMSGADLANLVNIAAVHAAVNKHSGVSLQDLEHAREKILMGPERKSAVLTEESKKITAYHEGGHALVAIHTDGAVPLYKATIVPRGSALGMVTQLPDEDEVHITKKQMLARMDVAMGGRAAEELIFGDDNITTGASSDLSAATRVARMMVERFGMTDVAKWVIGDDDAEVAGTTRQAVDKNVDELTKESYKRASSLLKSRRHELERVAQALLKYETLTADELRTVAQGRQLDRDD